MARSRRYGRGKSRGYYRFTAKRKAALKRAQFISAKNRKGSGKGSNFKKIATIGVLAGVGAGVAVAGYKNRDAIGAKVGDWRKAVSPDRKERTRSANAISVGHPSRTVSITPSTVQAPRMSTPITDSDRAQARNYREAERKKAEKEAKAVLGSEVEDMDSYASQAERRSSENQVDRQTRGILRAVKRSGTAGVKSDNTVKSPLERLEEGIGPSVRGRKTSSYKGTPGGKKTPAKTTRPKTPNGMTEEEHAAAIGFDTDLYHPPSEMPRNVSGTKLPGSGGGSAGVKASGPKNPVFRHERKDELHTLAQMRYNDELLLNPPETKSAAKKAPAKKAPAKKAAPTAGTDKTSDSMPKFSDAPGRKALPGMEQANKKLAELKRGAKKNLGIEAGEYVDTWGMLNDTQKMSLRKAALVWGHDISEHGKYYIIPGIGSGARG